MDNFIGTAGNDTFAATVVNAAAAAGAGAGTTLNASDLLTGGAGTDTLSMVVLGANSATGPVPLAVNTPVTSSVEVISVKNLSTGSQNGVTVNTAASSGITTVVNDSSTAAVAFTAVASNAAVNVISSKAATSVTFADAALATAITLALNVSAAGSAATPASITVATTTAAGTVTAATINAIGANFVALAGGASTAASIGVAAGVKSLTVTGAGSLNLTNTSALVNGSTLATDLTKLDASANTGGLTATVSNAKVVVTGGTGADTISLAGALTAGAVINLGAGNDKLLFATGGSIASTVTVDGGDGIDSVAAVLVNAGNAAMFKNFEKVDFGALAANFDLGLMTASTIIGLSMSAAVGGDFTVSNIANTVGLEVNGAVGATNTTTTTLTVNGALANTADVFNITFNGDAVVGVPTAAN